MKVNVTTQLTTMEGEPLAQPTARCPHCGQATEEVLITVRRVAVNALMANPPGKQSSGAEKVERYALALQINEEDEPNLKAEEIALIKALVGELYGPLVVGQVWALLDPAESQ